jgi:hypothetical protein
MQAGDRRPRRLKLEPVEQTPEWVSALENAVGLLAAGGIFLVMVGALVRPTAGGRRSTRLQWEQRARAAADAARHALAPPTR